MANEAGQGCASPPASVVDGWSFIDEDNPAEAGDVTALRTYKTASGAAGEVSFSFGTVDGTPRYSYSDEPDGNPFTMGTAAGCYEYTVADEDFTQFSVSVGHYLGTYQTENSCYATAAGGGHWRNSGSLIGQTNWNVTWDDDGDTAFGADISAAGGERTTKNSHCFPLGSSLGIESGTCGGGHR